MNRTPIDSPGNQQEQAASSPENGAGSDDYEQMWSQQAPPPSYLSFQTVFFLLLLGVLGALLAVGAYYLFSTDWLSGVKELFQESSEIHFVFWIIAGLVTGFLLIGLCRFLSFCDTRFFGAAEDQDREEE